MTVPQLFVDGKPLPIGKCIGKGGEGEVYQVSGDESRAVKFYTASDGPQREAKISAIVRMGLAKQSSLIAFPLAIARDQRGHFKGFLMRLVREHKPVFELYSPGARKQLFPAADYRFLARAAVNTAKAIAAVHKAGCVIGDINHSGILISQEATAALIDADSFQVTDGSKRYLCRVGVPEYTPPELQGVRLGDVVRTTNHDAFGLAITIFLLLGMGRHPFVGTYAKGEMPIHKAISEFRFAYSRKRSVGMTPPPGACTLDDFPNHVASAFEAAFGPSLRDKRPTASQWVSLLQEFERSLRKCSVDALHYYSSAARSCPWCRMEKHHGIVLFFPEYADLTISSAEAGAGDFNLPVLWAQIEAIRIPMRKELTSAFSVPTLPPSADAIKAKWKSRKKYLPPALGIMIGIAILFTVPKLWFVAFGAAIWGFVTIQGKLDPSSAFQQCFLTLEHEWNTALDRWEARCGIEKIENLKASLACAKRAYEALPAEQAELLNRYQSNRESFFRDQFLNTFRIRDSKIRGIGPSKRATLASYGIETAADLTQDRVVAVPGFGSVNSAPLLDWRRQCARKFVYNPQPSSTDQQEVRKIKLGISQRTDSLRQALTSEARELAQAVRSCRHMLAAPDPELKSLHARRTQIEVDLRYLNIPLPPRPPRSPRPQTYRAPHPTATSTHTQTAQQATKAATPACPRCQSRMVQRASRRGRRPGKPLWGCSRYPRCSGTRPI
jgi:DNA-binding helix-hairpin-helix protein with protein kinase domain